MRSYYEHELIPKYIGIGGTYEDFWHLNPRRLEVIYDGYKEWMKHRADEMYAEANYRFIAHSVALTNFAQSVFEKHKKKPLKFEDAVKRPEFIEKVIDEANMTHDDILRETDKLWAQFEREKVMFDKKKKQAQEGR